MFTRQVVSTSAAEPELSCDALALFSRCTVEYGDFVPMRLGLTQAVLLGHPELVEEVLVSRSQDFCKNLGTRQLRSVLGDGLLVSEGESWLRQRRLMQSATKFSRSCRPASTMFWRRPCVCIQAHGPSAARRYVIPKSAASLFGREPPCSSVRGYSTVIRGSSMIRMPFALRGGQMG